MTCDVGVSCLLHEGDMLSVFRQYLPYSMYLSRRAAGCKSIESDASLSRRAVLCCAVLQVYGGLLLMDFDPGYMAEHGHARLASLDPGAPKWLLAWRS